MVGERPQRHEVQHFQRLVADAGLLGADAAGRQERPRDALAGLVNPAYLLFALSSMGSGEANPCLAAVNAAVEVQGGGGSAGRGGTAVVICGFDYWTSMRRGSDFSLFGSVTVRMPFSKHSITKAMATPVEMASRP